MEPEYLSEALVRMSVDLLCSAEEQVAEAVTFRYPPVLIRTSIHDIFLYSMKITTLMDYISHCKTAPVNGWTHRVFIIHTRRDWVEREHSLIGVQQTSLFEKQKPQIPHTPRPEHLPGAHAAPILGR